MGSSLSWLLQVLAEGLSVLAIIVADGITALRFRLLSSAAEGCARGRTRSVPLRCRKTGVTSKSDGR
jgi:hypothetical protein